MSVSTIAETIPAQERPASGRRGRWVDGAALVIVWVVLAAPNTVAEFGWEMALRLPIEMLAVGVLALVLPRAAVRPVGIGLGLFLALVSVTKVLDAGFLVSFGRLSRPPWDWAYLDSGIDLLTVAVGRPQALLFTGVAAAVVLLVLVSVPWAVTRSLRVLGRDRRLTGRMILALGLVWILLLGWSRAGGRAPVQPSAATATVTADHVALLWNGLRDQRTFDAAVAVDPLQAIPDDALLSTLRGKDVLVIFVESYGRVALQNPGVDAVLAAGTDRLSERGFETRSAYVSSPTFGGISWLAHSTLQSGVWVDSQQRYDRLLGMPRSTLSSTFARAGWRTVSHVPSNEQPWGEGERFYGFDKTYDATNVGYEGPRFGYSTMPDQYVLDVFGRKELAPSPRQPVMAEIDLASSHTPWTPLPPLVPWSQVGDGSIFHRIPALGPSKDDLWRDADAVRAAYGASIEYSVTSVIEFIEKYGDPNLVVLMLGDHQPSTIVSGVDGGHDVPVSLIAADPRVLLAIDSWGWDPGLRPGQDAPVTGMGSLRDAFVTAQSG